MQVESSPVIVIGEVYPRNSHLSQFQTQNRSRQRFAMLLLGGRMRRGWGHTVVIHTLPRFLLASGVRFRSLLRECVGGGTKHGGSSEHPCMQCPAVGGKRLVDDAVHRLTVCVRTEQYRLKLASLSDRVKERSGIGERVARAQWVAAAGARGVEEEEAYVRELVSFILDREPQKACPLIEACLR